MKLKKFVPWALIATAILAVVFLLSVAPRKASASLPAGSPLAGAISCGSSASCATPAYLIGGETVIGTGTLAAGTVTITGLPFTSSTSYVCTWSDQTTAANGIGKVANVSAASITITSNVTTSNTDAVSYVCVGN